MTVKNNVFIKSISEEVPPGKDSLRLWLRLLNTTNLLEQYVRKKFRMEFDFTLPKFDVLAELSRSEKPQTMSELSRQLMVSNGNATGVIDRLQRDGLVQRLSSADDRRVQYISMTKKGRQAFRKMAVAHETWITEIMSGLKKSEIKQFNEELRHLKNIIVKSLEETDNA
jgi:DNA-binding MarR family transcriptional regulator